MDETIYHIEPLGIDVSARPGEKLMAAARRAGLKWPTICGGEGRCGICHVRVVSSRDPLPEPSELERAGLQLVPGHLQTEETRLACQMCATGEVAVFKTGVSRRSG